MPNHNTTDHNVNPTEAELRTTSKFLSLLLRHQPETIGLELDEHGWADIDELIVKARANSKRGRDLDRQLIELVVANNNKRRFAISDDGRQIRANQGHSIEVDLKFEPVMPPDQLFHGTATRFLDSIMEAGLTSQSRQHVHLAADRATAINVGIRHGKPIVLIVAASDMAAAGHEFFRSANGVWLTSHVPADRLEIL